LKASLEILTGERAGEKISLTNGRTYVLGRDQAVDIPLPEKKISRRHATLTVSEHGILIEDMQSLNGTFVNGSIIQGPTELQDRDRFQIGSNLFEVKTSISKSPEEYLSETTGDIVPLVRETDPGVLVSSLEYKEEQSHVSQASISGKLSEVSLPDLLQMLAATKKSGRLVIAPSKKELREDAPPGSPSLYIQKGELIGAAINGLKNEDAFYEILRTQNGYFSLFAGARYDWPSTIEAPLEALLLEGLRRMDEEKTAHFKFTADLSFEVIPDEPLTDLEPDELRLFQLVWRKKKLGQIWNSSHLDQKATDEIIRKLIKGNYVRKV
jgi:pSer/pThr/pTyr-binding forkhead associated (FHA) protein